MNLQSFVQTRQPRWARLNELLTRIQSSRLSKLGRAELKEFGQLYRAVSSDLAHAQTNFPQSNVTYSLNELVARCHHHVYQSKKVTWRGVKDFYAFELPRIFRRNLGCFALSASLFFGMALIGCFSTIANEEVARVVLSQDIIDHVHQGQMWTKGFFDVVPSSVASSMILTNNISVSFLAFALGITFGIGTAYVMLANGLMLGSVFGLCAQYGMLGDLVGFVTAHGVVEISVILVAGAAGLMLGSAVLRPADHRRRDAIALRGIEGAKLVLGCAPLLVLVGIVEGFISPSANIPPTSKIGLGILLGAVLYLYLFRAGRAGNGRATP